MQQAARGPAPYLSTAVAGISFISKAMSGGSKQLKQQLQIPPSVGNCYFIDKQPQKSYHVSAAIQSSSSSCMQQAARGLAPYLSAPVAGISFIIKAMSGGSKQQQQLLLPPYAGNRYFIDKQPQKSNHVSADIYSCSS